MDGVIPKQIASIHAVDGVSFHINKGETLSLVGESGCGKTTLARVVLRLIEATSGSVKYMGQDLFKLSNEKMRELRQEMAMIFQNPEGSLNPRMTISDIIGEPLDIHGIAKKDERKRIIVREITDSRFILVSFN